MLGDETQTFHRLPFSLFLASNCFPCCFFCFLLLFVGWENVPQQVPNMHSYSKYVTFRGKVVCRKCYTEWKRSLLYIFLIISYWYRYQSVIIHKIYIYLPPWKSMWFTEEIALSTLNLSVYMHVHLQDRKLHQKWHWSTQSEGRLLSCCTNQFQASLSWLNNNQNCYTILQCN